MNSEIKKIRNYQKQGYRIYVYGAGLWGRNVYNQLCKNDVNISGFVVTKIESSDKVLGMPVFDYFSIEHERAVLVLGLNQHNTKEVDCFLESRGFEKDRVFYTNDVMELNDKRCGYDEIPCLDITTKIGCSVNCKYCPQEVLLKEYFKTNPNRENCLSIDTLAKCMENMPINTNYQFCGMAEPFLNPDCFELIKFVCDAKYIVNLYTTLVGVNEETLYKLLELPIDYVTLHVADAKGYAKIPTSEEYYHLLETAVNCKKKNGRMFVDMCNAQAEPDARVYEICMGKHMITSSLLDRAGNLEGEGLITKRLSEGKIVCGVCGKSLNKNELLPDGTLLLCCMDYGMKHQLGNLKEQSYEDIMKGSEMQRIRKGMGVSQTSDILCRYCSCANLED